MGVSDVRVRRVGTAGGRVGVLSDHFVGPVVAQIAPVENDPKRPQVDPLQHDAVRFDGDGRLADVDLHSLEFGVQGEQIGEDVAFAGDIRHAVPVFETLAYLDQFVAALRDAADKLLFELLLGPCPTAQFRLVDQVDQATARGPCGIGQRQEATLRRTAGKCLM